MTARIGSNCLSLAAQRRLADTTAALTSIFERLSSGQRINKASDDAAGLAVAVNLAADTRVYGQAIRNINDGVSALNIVESAFEQLTTISIRQKELASQAASGTYSLAQRRAMNTEANALVEEFNRIIDSTKFNGIHLTDNSLPRIRIQAGYGTDGGLSFEIGKELARTAGRGSFNARAAHAAGSSPIAVALSDLNNDGCLDIVSADSGAARAGVYLGRGDGSFAARTSYVTGAGVRSIALGDLNGDAILDMVTADRTDNRAGVLLGKGDGTFYARTSFSTGTAPFAVTLGDLNGDKILDMVTADSGSDCASVFIGKGDGGFCARAAFTTGDWPASISLGDLNGDAVLDIVAADTNSGEASVLLGKGDGSFHARISYSTGSWTSSVALGDLNGDGVLDMTATNYGDDRAMVFLGRGDGTFADSTSYSTGNCPETITLGDLNGDGIADMVTVDRIDSKASVFIGKGDGSFFARSSFSTGVWARSIALGDVNRDGVLEMVTADTNANTVSTFLARTRRITTIGRLHICTREGALDAMGVIDATLGRIALERGALGSMQSRFGSALNTLAASRENFAAAGGRIMDCDVANESSDLLRRQILQRAAGAILAQANQQPALAIQLVG